MKAKNLKKQANEKPVKKTVCVNKECKLRKAGCQSSLSCPGFKGE